jgi:hypothetical protein
LLGKPEEKRPLGKPRRRWQDDIRKYLTEIAWEVVDWIHLAQYRDQCADSCEYDNNAPSGSIKGGELLTS